MSSTDDGIKVDQQRWLAAHRLAGVWAGISGLPLVFPMQALFVGFDAPFQVLLASVPLWLVQRRCPRIVIAMTGAPAASAIWLLLDASAWCWLLRGLMLFWIRNTLWFQQPALSQQLLTTATNLAMGTLLFLGVGCAVGLVQACWAKRGPWRLRWILASALSLASGFGLLFGLPQLALLMLRLLRLGSFSIPAPLWYGLLLGFLWLCSWLYWQLRGWITLRLVISRLPA